MNIAIHIHGLKGGGAERAVSLLAEDLVQLGHRVLLVTCEHDSPNDYPVPSTINRVAIGEGSADYRLVRAGKRLWRLRQALAAFNADVVLGFMTTSALYALGASVGLEARTVCCERVAPGRQVLSRLSALLRRHLFPFADAVVCQTASAATWYRAHLTGGRIEAIPNAVRLPLPDQAPKLTPSEHVADDALLLLAVGRLDRQKGFDLLIEAFAQAVDQLSEVQLVVLGEGPERSTLEAMIADHGLHQRVLLPGRAGNVAQWYHRADAFVLSSRFEGFPNVLLEAMAHAVPVLATNCDFGPAELIVTEQSGLLVAADDAGALGHGLTRLLTDSALRANLGAAGQTAAGRFAPDSIAIQWQRLLTELCSPGKVPS